MTIRDKLNADPGFNYVIDSMELMSSTGRRFLMQQPLLTDALLLEKEYSNIDRVKAVLTEECHQQSVSTLLHQLMQMHDLQGTLLNLQHHMTLEEIELFEIKSFAFLCMTAARASKDMGIDDILSIPDLHEVFNILDPDRTNIPSFYIYDSYHPDLPDIRRQLKAKQTLLEKSESKTEESATIQQQINSLFEQHNAIQHQVIVRLSDNLQSFHSTLQEALKQMAYADLLFAKATLAKEWNLCHPHLTTLELGKTCYRSLWNPRLKSHNEEIGLRYQPVDIELSKGVCLITGANMAGKTVLLKTVGISQLMAQFGFFVPAAEATVALVDDIILCIGDGQNEMNGLSSYASEIIKISDTIRRADNEKLLILIDEPARTTNPIEGKAIVQSVAKLLDKRNSATLITTHYSQLEMSCRRLRVKGFVESMSDSPLTPENINSFMDYSLLPDESEEVPQEALRIASILGCDSRLLDTATEFLQRQ